MEYRTDTPHHQHLSQQFQNREAAVFCGVGVSLEYYRSIDDQLNIKSAERDIQSCRDNINE